MDSLFEINWSTLVLLAFIIIIVAVLRTGTSTAFKPTWRRETSSTTTEKGLASNQYNEITALPNFNWKTKAPIALRPFKPTYHLTMGLENLSLDELIEVDNTYEARIKLRRQILRDHPSTMGARPGCDAAVNELYAWMTTVYLPSRFPSMYSLENAEKPTHLVNRTTGETIPLHPESVQEALRALGGHVDTDFLFLLPAPETGKYHLEAFVTTFPSGFSTQEKLGVPLAAIHKPVPGYSAKLEKSMDRFFANLQVGKIVKRANWSITTNDILYAEHGNHLYADEADNGTDSKKPDVESGGLEDEIARQRAEVEVANCRLRCERQTLHRLPCSKALIFAFKTYQYKLSDVKGEGSGEGLADAIEGLSKGSVPEMAFYKREVVWGEKVKEYLRS